MGISYLRGYRDPHRGLRVWSIVARTMPNFLVLRVPMHIPDGWKWLGHGRFMAFVFKLWGHLLLVARIQKVSHGSILVREFLTWPLLLIAPFLFFKRHSLWFLCQHNLAFANVNSGHRVILRVLRRVGFGFVLFEDASAWNVIEPNAGPLANVRSIPLPFQSEKKETHRRNAGAKLMVGFVGNFRKEKSPIWALEILAKAFSPQGLLPDCELLVGSPDAEFRAGCLSYARVIDTGTYASYLAALDACDIVVLPYDGASYAYRSSGVLAEALTCGCAVVVPDVPTLRNQVLDPIPIGSCYADQSGLIAAVQAAAAIVRSGSFGAVLDAHYAVRGPASVYSALEGLTK
jgi:glycosyltransferase involved in cell wall biosynthesis